MSSEPSRTRVGLVDAAAAPVSTVEHDHAFDELVELRRVDRARRRGHEQEDGDEGRAGERGKAHATTFSMARSGGAAGT
jgi:hypothetical protein